MTEVEKELYRDKDGKLLGRCHICGRQLVRHTTSINRIISSLECQQSKRNSNFCNAYDNLEYSKRLESLRKRRY